MKTIELLLSEKIMNKFSPSHYQRGKIQVWDFIADQELDFFTGNIIGTVTFYENIGFEIDRPQFQLATTFWEDIYIVLSLIHI